MQQKKPKKKSSSPKPIPNHPLPPVRVKRILSYEHLNHDCSYRLSAEEHPYYEFVYIDRGTLDTKINEISCQLKEQDILIYGPGQLHTQDIPVGSSCSYITVCFELESDGEHYHYLLNRIFHYTPSIHALMRTLVKEQGIPSPYRESLILCLFEQIIIRLMQSEYQRPKKDKTPATVARQNYQSRLLEQILAYMDSMLYEPLTIAEICDKFSVSRTTLQTLFNDNLHQSPKQYMSDLKMERCRQLISEERYGIGEIATIMGYTSIHYFSRAFTLKYNMTPTEYAKTLYKDNQMKNK